MKFSFAILPMNPTVINFPETIGSHLRKHKMKFEQFFLSRPRSCMVVSLTGKQHHIRYLLSAQDSVQHPFPALEVSKLHKPT